MVATGLQLLVAIKQHAIEFWRALDDFSIERSCNLIESGVRTVEQNDTEIREQSCEQLGEG